MRKNYSSASNFIREAGEFVENHPYYKAVHLEGGNHFDNMRINLAESYKTQDEYLKRCQKKSQKSYCLLNYFKLFLVALLKKIKVYDSLVINGFINHWYRDFLGYWTNVLGGRFINVFEFNSLYFNYRTKIQSESESNWENSDSHIQNWQHPKYISHTFHYALKGACRPAPIKGLFKHLQSGMNVLEYGCSLAPCYQQYKTFMGHKKVNWILADIPNFPFHYARHLYGADENVKTIVINASDFSAPLGSDQTTFDIIILKEVFEHLDNPLFLAKYLLSKLKKDGLFIFDYVVSEGTGLDTIEGTKQREETLKFLQQNLKIISGNFKIDNENVGLCFGKKC